MNLPDMTGIEEMFQEKAGAWADLVRKKDSREFIRRMHSLRKKLEQNNPDFGRAYENMYKLT